MTDQSDDPSTAAANDPTIVNTVSNATIEVSKTATVTQNDGNATNDSGDVIVYTIVVTNTGNVTLSNLNLVDTLTNGNGGSLTLSSGPTFVSATAGSTSSTLVASGVASFTAQYTISQAAANTGSVNNTVTVSYTHLTLPTILLV